MEAKNAVHAYEANDEELAATAADLKEAIDMDSVTVDDLITLTARLAQVMAHEADLLEDMKISQIAALQKEKVMLANALELTKKQIAKRPEILQDMDDQDREDLEHVVTLFNTILEENYKRLSTARAVNQHVVQAITDVVQEKSTRDVYDQKGAAGKPTTGSLSVTLDEKV